MDSVDPRFKGIYQLVGPEHFTRIAQASVCVVGLGGVGSWSVEALARSGVGALTLVDLDEVCVTNINRQVHALTDTVGRPKADLLADRVKAINPECKVTIERRFFTANTADQILAPGFDVVLDTIDRNENKTTLIGECVKRSLRVITVGAGGDRLDAYNLSVTDLARTIHDPLLQIVRKQLRQNYGFPKGERAKFHVPCVYVPKQRGARDKELARECSLDNNSRKSCNDGLGSAVYVTGVLGFAAAGEVVNMLNCEISGPLYPWLKSCPVD